MRPCPVQQDHVERDPSLRQPSLNYLRDFPRTSRHFQQEKMFCPGSLRSTFHHLSRGGNAAEPAVHPTDIPQRILYVSRRASVGIENLRCVDSVHGKGLSD
jgi:hypothetical protein